MAAEDLERQEVLERVMDLAAARGVPVEDLASALVARAGVRPPERKPVLFVECNELELEQYKAELAEQFPVLVEAALLEDLEDLLQERVSDTEPPPLAVSGDHLLPRPRSREVGKDARSGDVRPAHGDDPR